MYYNDLRLVVVPPHGDGSACRHQRLALTLQKDGIWYFSRRVPADLRRHYQTGRIAYSLRTKSVRDARVRAMSDAAKLDRHWH